MPSVTAHCELSLPACTVLGCEVRELSLFWAPWQGQAVIYGVAGSVLACCMHRGEQVSFRSITADATVCELVPRSDAGSRLVLGKATAEVMLQRARGGIPGLVQASINVTVSYEFTSLAVSSPVTPAAPPAEMFPAASAVPVAEILQTRPAQGPAPKPPAPAPPPMPRPHEDRNSHESPWGTTIRRYASPGSKLPRAFSSLLLAPRPRRDPGDAPGGKRP